MYPTCTDIGSVHTISTGVSTLDTPICTENKEEEEEEEEVMEEEDSGGRGTGGRG